MAFRQKFNRRIRRSARRDVQTIARRGSTGNISISADDTPHRDGDALLLHSILQLFQTPFGKIGKRRQRSNLKSPRLFRETNADFLYKTVSPFAYFAKRSFRKL